MKLLLTALLLLIPFRVEAQFDDSLDTATYIVPWVPPVIEPDSVCMFTLGQVRRMIDSAVRLNALMNDCGNFKMIEAMIDNRVQAQGSWVWVYYDCIPA